jgi:hypothetical protein
MVDLTGNDPSRRAPRYWISSPLTFREGLGPWHQGTSVNICARGLLFRTRKAMPVSSEIDVHLTLAGGAAIRCSGRVVRAEQCVSTGESLIAVAIHRFKFRREAPARELDAHS